MLEQFQHNYVATTPALWLAFCKQIISKTQQISRRSLKTDLQQMQIDIELVDHHHLSFVITITANLLQQLVQHVITITLMILHGMVKTVPVVTTVTLYIRDQPIMLLCLPIMLCYSALKIYLLSSILCSRTRIAGRLLCYLCTRLQKQLVTCSR